MLIWIRFIKLIDGGESRGGSGNMMRRYNEVAEKRGLKRSVGVEKG